MPKTYMQDSLGFTIPIEGPATVEEFDKQAGVSGATLAAGVDDAIKHGHLGRFRAKLIPALEESTGIKRNVVNGADGAKDIVEGDKAYMIRITVGEGKTCADYENIAQDVAIKLGPLDLQPQRSSGASKEYVNAANQIIAAIKSGAKTWPAMLKVLQSVVPGLQVEMEEDGLPNVESFAMGLRAHRLAMLAASKSQFGI